MTRPDGSLIAPRFQESIDGYVEHHHRTGGFLQAVLSDKLIEAISRADEQALDNLPHIVAYLWNEVPSGCWGSPEKVQSWLTPHPEAEIEFRRGMLPR